MNYERLIDCVAEMWIVCGGDSQGFLLLQPRVYCAIVALELSAATRIGTNTRTKT